ncbi:MAG: DUF1844 domain-containing protein [Bradymonadia bacterium]
MAKETDSKLFRASPDGQTTVESQPKSDTKTPPHLNVMSFSTHILSLNMTALMHLGEVEGLEPADQDRAAARHLVDTLTMLREKTQGNLTEEESKLLTALLYDLKLKIVQTA